ncbi:MAG TPA: SDR family NAD(P)-dependent oxidoreductase, partial [Chitinophagaceae bacterium]|nr:SDR family NAD(P)-dependent oxidoreductase [Chitinophagaceae bacterium]
MKKILPFMLLLTTITGSAKQVSSPEQIISHGDTTIITGPYALIAGGSKGIGYAIAVALARRHYNLILIARNLDSLLEAKQKLESAYGIHVD